MATYLPNVTDVIPEPSLFTPDYSFLDKMLKRRQGLYEQGFAQVNSAYNFVNRAVTNPYSVQVRDKFLQQAKENLKNLSTLDLSQQQNVTSARGVFEPFVKNQPVLMDMAYTAHMDQQDSIAEGYRLRDGGKEFSEDNLNYLRQQRSAFANDDISKVGSYYANRRSYTPYYDYYKEVQDKMKDFKPSTYKYDRISGLYKITDEDSSWREAEVSEYLSGVLSDKAKQQMRIEAQVRLGNNPEALSAAFQQSAQQQLEINSYNLKNIDKNLSLAKDPKVIEQLKARRQQIEDDNRSINTNIESIQKGDLSYVKDNSERLSSVIYFNGKLKGFVKSFAHDEIVRKLDGDEVGIALMKEDRADSRQQKAFAHAEKMKKWELGMVPGNYQVRNLAEGENGINLQTTINGLQEGINENDAEIARLTNASKQHILMKVKERDPNSKVTLKDITGDYVKNWINTGGPGGTRVPSTDPYFQNEKQLASVTSRRSSLQNRLDKIEQGTLQGMSAQEQNQVKQINQKIGALGDIKLDDGTTISASEFATGLKNGTIKASLNISGTSGTIKIKGKEYQVDDRLAGRTATPVKNNVSLLSTYSQIKGIQSSGSDAYDKYVKNRDKFMKDNFTELRLGTTVLSFDANSPNAKSLEGSVGTYLPEGYDIKHAGVGATPTNQGNAYFYITPKAGNDKSDSQIEAELIAGGAKVRVIKTDKGPTIYEIKGLNNGVANQYRQYGAREAEVISEMQSYTGSGAYHSAPFTTSGGDTKFIMKKFGGMYYLHIDGLGESYPDAFATPADAIGAARHLSANGGAQLFKQFSQGSTAPTLDVSGADYDYRY